MGQAKINVRTRACSRTSIARTKQAALTHNVRGKELTIKEPTFLSRSRTFQFYPNQNNLQHANIRRTIKAEISQNIETNWCLTQ